MRALPRGDRRAERAARARLHHARLLATSDAAAAVAACAARSKRCCAPGSPARRRAARSPPGSPRSATSRTTPSGRRVARAGMAARARQIAGLTFAETDEIAMALELAVREVPAWNEILQTQLDRTQNPDRKARFAFVMPALSADPRTREQAFDAVAAGREPPPRAVGARVARLSESSAARARTHGASSARASSCCARSSAPATSSFRRGGLRRR